MRSQAKALPQHIIDCMSPEDRKSLHLKTTNERVAASETKSEAQIQKVVEAYCVQCGYVKVNAENIQLSKIRKDYPPKGWQYHLSPHGAKKNPMLPDITLFDNQGRFLWLELKTPTGKLSEFQRIMVEIGWWKVAYNAEDAVEIVMDWVR